MSRDYNYDDKVYDALVYMMIKHMMSRVQDDKVYVTCVQDDKVDSVITCMQNSIVDDIITCVQDYKVNDVTCVFRMIK